jgi:hypothetical protein
MTLQIDGSVVLQVTDNKFLNAELGRTCKWVLSDQGEQFPSASTVTTSFSSGSTRLWKRWNKKQVAYHVLYLLWSEES